MQQPCGQGTKQSSSGLLTADWQAKQDKQSLSLQTTINKETTLEFAAIRCHPLLRRRRFRQPAQTSPARTNHLSQRHVRPSPTPGRPQVVPSRPAPSPARTNHLSHRHVLPSPTPGRPQVAPSRPAPSPARTNHLSHRHALPSPTPGRPQVAPSRPAPNASPHKPPQPTTRTTISHPRSTPGRSKSISRLASPHTPPQPTPRTTITHLRSTSGRPKSTLGCPKAAPGRPRLDPRPPQVDPRSSLVDPDGGPGLHSQITFGHS